MLQTIENIDTVNAELEARFARHLSVNSRLNRQLVSFQANKKQPGYRWFKYKEGFSEALVHYLLDHLRIESGLILDPFAGSGTTLFAARERGINTFGIELLPVGYEVIEVRKLTLEQNVESLRQAIDRWLSTRPYQQSKAKSFPHLRITSGAFPDETQCQLEQYLAAVETETQPYARLLRFAAMCVLEEISYTRKDGQYLRWDYRSERRQGSRPFDKGTILSFETAIQAKLEEIYADLQPNRMFDLFSSVSATGEVTVEQASCLNVLPTLDAQSFDGLITSPPYCNRYDYTRTYALELALLGVDEPSIRQLRQAMLSCTVENREKTELNTHFSDHVFQRASTAFEGQYQLQTILNYLEEQKQLKNLNNPGIPRMIKNYFFEMALVIFESARLLKPNAPLVMVNDNVRYGGAAIPVDLILSDFAEQAGFDVEAIWVLPTGKGNSSQQMGLHGREELRKSIYIWRR